MEINVTARLPKTGENSCQIFFLFSDGKLKGAARKVDAGSANAIKTVIKNKDFTGASGQILTLHSLSGSTTDRVMLVGLGDRANASREQWFEACAAAAKALCATPSVIGMSDCLICCPLESMSMAEQASNFACELVKATYVFNLHDGKNTPQEKVLNQFFLSANTASITTATNAVIEGTAIGHGIEVAKNLGNLAPNICTPEYLANRAVTMAHQFADISTTILEESDMEALGMGALLAVSRGSRQAAKLIVMNYQGRRRVGSPIVLVGKGITFDTGGISIKPSAAMDEMKFDMCGAASVFGAMQAVAELSPNLNIIGIVAAAENMPGGDAARPGDVVTSMSGQSIEILNTDAEGRLVLCDALTYAEQFKPTAVIDIATLTGACVVALGDVASAVMGNHQDTIDALLVAAEKSGDYCWQLPLLPAYQKQLDSNFADMANIGGSKAGAITAGCFLSRFATTMNWAHLDVAGTAWNSGTAKGATGRPVPLLMQYILDRAEKI
ncbi:MAG: leucyl aminopeptidase [Granulosicoccus sp.]|jgi:leucyl aminopeptidase